ncbi:hypothetical protein J2W25_002103 [Variovorax boronicumulans]|uniref:Uncharacterized protein n=1 Tax=Variovorax boronicumulans TaxID=436515 RepID=A0AAW8DUT6_9BURK|nr:hypothetical protein [Variovorax boronicumulans]
MLSHQDREQLSSRQVAAVYDIRNPNQVVVWWAAAGFVDTDLSFSSLFELYGTDVAERRVSAHRVVEPLDVIEHVGASLLPAAVHLPGCALSLH